MSDAPGSAENIASISVIMPAFNAAHYLEKSLPPLIAMRKRGEVAEVIVVDDCSTDPSSVATAQRLGATILEMPENGGPGAARNFAAKAAVGDILWLVDADVIVHDDAAHHVARNLADPEFGAVFGSYDDHPTATNFASSYKNLIHRYYHQRGHAESDTFWSGCGAIKKCVYDELGGFDGTRYGRPSIEDIEFGFRMRKAGWRIRLDPQLLATHLKHWRLGEVVRTDIFQRARPWSFLILSGRGMNDDLNVSQNERLKAGIAGLWAIAILASANPFWHPHAGLALLLTTAAVLLANWPLFRFFQRARGPAFALAACAYHQFYYLYSAATFVACAIAYHLGGKKDAVVRRADIHKISA